ncbi:dnaJ subfamily C member 11-like protein, partial [Leptotrombidium deliense]
LSDPQKRAIYDTVGLKGLEIEGWQIIQRTKTVQEIREEFEKLQKEKEERMEKLRTNPRGIVAVGINATDLFERNVDYVSYDVFGFPNLEVTSISIQQSVDLPLDSSDTSSLSANINVSNGKGSGSVIGGFRRIFSPQTWGETHLAIGQGPLVTFKLFRTLSRKTFFTTNSFVHFSNGRIKPGIDFVIARNLTKQTVGYLTWKPFPQSFMNTAIAWSSNKNHVLAQL